MIRVFQAISDPASCHGVDAKREDGSRDEIPLSFRGDSRAKNSVPSPSGRSSVCGMEPDVRDQKST